MSDHPVSLSKKAWPYVATLSSASVMLLAFFIPSIQDQYDRYQSRKVIDKYVSLGDEFMEEEHYDLAEKAYEKAFELTFHNRLEIEVKRIKARVHRMSQLVEWGAKPPEDLEEVDFQLLLHLQKGPQDARERGFTLNSYASYLAGTKKYKEAEDALAEALQIDPRSAMFHLNLGNVQDQRGKKDEALKSYLKALELDPKSLNAHYNLGLLYVEMGKNPEARLAFEAALKIAPEDADTAQQLKRLAKKMNEIPPP